jgi:hypothetical protein
MKTGEFNNIGNSDEKWTCPSCSKQNNSSSIVYHVPENPQESTIKCHKEIEDVCALGSVQCQITGVV